VPATLKAKGGGPSKSTPRARRRLARQGQSPLHPVSTGGMDWKK
jgi:hypothetical protein